MLRVKALYRVSERAEGSKSAQVHGSRSFESVLNHRTIHPPVYVPIQSSSTLKKSRLEKVLSLHFRGFTLKGCV